MRPAGVPRELWFASARTTSAAVPDEIAEAEKRVEFCLRRMEHAIATHDFPGARFYSNEDLKARENCGCCASNTAWRVTSRHVHRTSGDRIGRQKDRAENLARHLDDGGDAGRLARFVFMIGGIERFRPVSGVATNRMLGEIPYSHSLLMDALWAASLGGVDFTCGAGARRAAPLLLFGAVLSHWVLDVISHRPDMALAPGVKPLLGLGLWNSLPATVMLEGGVWLAAIILYVRATKSKNWLGLARILVGDRAADRLLAWKHHRRHRPQSRRAGVNGLVFFSLMIAWAYWMNRARYFKTSSM